MPLARGLEQFNRNIDTIASTITENRERNLYNDYLTQINGNPFEAQRPEKLDRPDLWNRAMVETLDYQLTKGNLAQQHMDIVRRQGEKQKEGFLNQVQRAESIAATSTEAGVAAYMDAYNKTPNGVSVKYDTSRKIWEFHDQMTGEKWEENVTLDDARRMAKSLMESSNYEKLFIANRETVTQFNKQAALHPDIIVDKDGNQMTMLKMLDPNTGDPKHFFVGPDGTPQEITVDDIIRGGFRMQQDLIKTRMSNLGYAKEEAALEHQRAETGLTRARTEETKVKTDKTKEETAQLKARKEEAPEPDRDKDVGALMSAYNISEAEAMDILRRDKHFGTLVRAAQTEIQEAMLDPMDPRDQPQMEEIYRRWGVEGIPGQEGMGQGQPQGEGLGLERKQPKVDVTQYSGQMQRVLSALDQQFPDAPEGEVKYLEGTNKGFIRQNGQWISLEE